MKKKWHDDYYFKIVDLAKSGMSKNQIVNTLGWSMGTLKRFMRLKPLLKEKLEEALRTQGHRQTYKEYVYNLLPDKLKRVWDKLKEMEKQEVGVSRVEALLSKYGKDVRQHLFLYALTELQFNVSRACKRVNVTLHTFRKWCEEDPDFAELVDEMNFHKGNFFEEHFIKLIQAGDSAATIHAMKTYNRERGYNDKQEITVTGEFTHKHQMVTMEELDNMEPEQLQKIMEAIENKKEPKAITQVPSEEVIEEVVTPHKNGKLHKKGVKS